MKMDIGELFRENQKISRSNELLARQVEKSVNQIKRYIRLTYLIRKLLDMVDEGKIAFTIAVELLYLSIDYLVRGKELDNGLSILLEELSEEKRELAMRIFRGIIECI